MHILVIDVDGKITGNAGTLLERYIGVSKASDSKSSVGEANYYVEVIQQKSEYIYWGEHETGLFDVDSASVEYSVEHQLYPSTIPQFSRFY